MIHRLNSSWISFGYVLVTFCAITFGDLRIGVLKKNGDTMPEILKSDVDAETITIEFRTDSGNHVTQTVDLLNNVQIIRVYKLGEMEVHEPVYKTMCFVVYANKSDFISAEAMSHLGQKHPEIGRTANFFKGIDTYTMDYLIDLGGNVPSPPVNLLSPSIASLCRDAYKHTYTRDADIRQWNVSQDLQKRILVPLYPKRYSSENGASSVPQRYANNAITSCGLIHYAKSSCECTLSVWIDWYPCKLKLCEQRKYDPERGKYVKLPPRRCGIHSCKRGYNFVFYVPQKDLCLPDY